MPELHSNQIPWQAPEPTHVQLEKTRDWLGPALAEVGNTLQKSAETVAAYQDNQLAKTLEDVAKKTQQKFDMSRSLNANYDQMAADAMAEWDAAFNQFGGATKRRFLNKDPYAREAFEIQVTAVAKKKRDDQIYNHSKLDIAQWSTEIVTAPKDAQNAIMEQKRQSIQNLGLSLERTDSLLFDLQSEVDNYQIAYDIANGNFASAEDRLNNGLPTVGAGKRAMLHTQLKAAIEAESARKAQEEKARLAAEESGQGNQFDLLMDMHQKLLEEGKLEDAEDVRQKIYYGDVIQIYDDKGKFIGQIDTSKMSRIGREKVADSMLTRQKRAPYMKDVRADYMAQFNALASSLMNKDGSLNLDEKSMPSLEQVVMAQKLKRDKFMWNNELDEKQQTFINNILRSSSDGVKSLDINPAYPLRARAESDILGVYSYQKANPAVVLPKLLEIYDSPANSIVAALDSEHTLTGRDIDTISLITQKYKDDNFFGEYKLSKGTRSDALVSMIGIIMTNANSRGMQEVGLQGVSREALHANLKDYVVQMKEGGRFDDDANYEALLSDFNNVYRMTTGHQFNLPKEADGRRKYVTLASQLTKSDMTHPEQQQSGRVYDLPRDEAYMLGKTHVKDVDKLYAINKHGAKNFYIVRGRLPESGTEYVKIDDDIREFEDKQIQELRRIEKKLDKGIKDNPGAYSNILQSLSNK